MSRTVIQQRTVEQIVGSPAAKVVELVPQIIVQLVGVPQTVSRGRTWQRVDEQIDDPPVPKVLEELVEKGIAERFVVQIADVTDCLADLGRIGEPIVDALGSHLREEAVEVMRLTPHEPGKNFYAKVVKLLVVLKIVSRDGIQRRIEVFESASQDRTAQHMVDQFFDVPVTQMVDCSVEVAFFRRVEGG